MDPSQIENLKNIMDINNLLMLYVNPLLTGIERLGLDILIIATLLACIEFTLDCIKNFGNIENIISIFVNKLLKFAVVFLAINSFRKILDFSLQFFLELGVAFGGTRSFIASDNTFDFNRIWAYLGEMLVSVSKITANFSGNHGIFYALVLLAVLIMSATIVILLFVGFLEYYLVGTFMFLTLPMNVFTPIADLSKQVIKAFIITGMKLSIYIILLNISIEVLSTELAELESLGIAQNKNDISAMLFFLVLLTLMCAIFLSLEGIAMYILTGSGTGLSFVRLGNMATQGVSTAVNTGITVAAIFAGGSGLVKAGADAGIKGAQAAEKTRRSVKSFSNVKNAAKVARKGADTVNRGIAKATDSEEQTKPTKQTSLEKMKGLKSAFQKGKSKK